MAAGGPAVSNGQPVVVSPPAASRRRARIAWALCAAAFATVAVGLVVGYSDPAYKSYFIPIALPFSAVGALLASQRPKYPIGWLFLAFGVGAALNFVAEQYAHRALVTDPGSLLGAGLVASFAAHARYALFGFLVFSLLLFPSGRLPSPRWRWVAYAAVSLYVGLAISGPFDSQFLHDDIPQAEPLVRGTIDEVATNVFGVLVVLNVFVLLVSGASLLLRLRSARPDERQQIRWFVFGVAFVMFALPIPIWVLGHGEFAMFLLPIIPAAAGIAILRYRLYDIDVVINRTLVYGALTATLAATYLGSVLLFQLALSGLTQDSGLAVAGSTLAVAALFRPARTRIQEAVDRRFFRRRYDAARTLESFSARLRDQVDLAALDAELRGVVAETMQPAHVSLWLREAPR